MGLDLAAAAVPVSLGEPDNPIEQLGWRPKTKIIEGPAGAKAAAPTPPTYSPG